MPARNQHNNSSYHPLKWSQFTVRPSLPLGKKTIATYRFRQQPKYGQQNIGKLFKDFFHEFLQHVVHIMWCSSSRPIKKFTATHNTKHATHPILTMAIWLCCAFLLWRLEKWKHDFFLTSSSHNNLERCWPLQPWSWIPEFECFFWHRCPKTLYLSFQQTAVKEHGMPRLVSHLAKFRQGLIQPFLRRSGSHENLEVNPNWNWTFVPFQIRIYYTTTKITTNAWAPEKKHTAQQKNIHPSNSSVFTAVPGRRVPCTKRRKPQPSFYQRAWRAPVSEKPRKWRHQNVWCIGSASIELRNFTMRKSRFPGFQAAFLVFLRNFHGLSLAFFACCFSCQCSEAVPCWRVLACSVVELENAGWSSGSQISCGFPWHNGMFVFYHQN